MTYWERLEKWRAGRIFRYINPVILKKGQATCDACGCKQVKIFYILQDIETERIFMVGGECFKHMDTVFVIRYQFIEDPKVIIEKHLASRGLE